VEWYAHREKAAEGSYVEGAMHGLWTAWHPNGRVRMRAWYDRGRRCGVWSEYAESGEEVRRVEFRRACPGEEAP